jgi:MFS family permease
MTTDRGNPFTAGYTLFLLFLVNMFSIGDRILLGIVTEPVKQELGLSDTQMSLANGFLFVSFNLIIGLFIARWVDQGNRKRILAIGVAVWSLATALTAFANDFYILALSRILVGAGEATVFPVALSMIADLFKPSARPRSVAIFQSSIFVGLIGGSIIAGVLAAAHGWRTMFIICGLAGFVLLALMVVTMKEPNRLDVAPNGRKRPVSELPGQIGTVLKVPGFVWLTLGLGVSAMGGAILSAWGPAFLQRSHGVPLAQVGAVIGPAVGLGGIFGTIASGFGASFLSRKFGDQRYALLIPIIGMPLAAPFVAGFVLATELSSAMFAAFVMNVLLSAAVAPCMALNVSIVRPDQRGMASALMLIANGVIGGALAPYLVGAVSDALTPQFGVEALRYALCVMIAPPVVGALVLILAYRKIATEIGHLDPSSQGAASAAH